MRCGPHQCAGDGHRSPDPVPMTTLGTSPGLAYLSLRSRRRSLEIVVALRAIRGTTFIH